MAGLSGCLDSGGVTDLEYADSILIARDPEATYAMVSDVTRMGEWSPVCRACWWDDGEGPHVGAWFTGRNQNAERTWETRSQVVAADPGREFAWEVNDGWVRWGFALEPADGSAGRSEATGAASPSTRLTQSWKFLPKGIARFRDRYGERADDEIAARSAAAKSGIPETLAAIKASAETT